MGEMYTPERSEPGSLGAQVVALVRRQPLLSAMAGCAVLGFGIAVYLTTIHYANVAPVCSVTSIINCSNVLKSSFSTVPGTSLPITVPGMLWFLVSGGLAGAGLVSSFRGDEEPARLRLYQLLWSAAGMLFVLYLVYAEIVQLRNICEWCTGVHILTLITFILAWYRFSQPDGAAARPSYTSPAPSRAEHRQSVASMNDSRAPTGYALPRSVRAKATGSRKSGRARHQRS